MPSVQQLIMRIPAIQRRHDSRMRGETGATGIDEAFADVDELMELLRRVNGKSLAALNLLQILFDELCCPKDAFLVRQEASKRFPHVDVEVGDVPEGKVRRGGGVAPLAP